MFSFRFAYFLVFFWLNFKYFCLVSTYRSISYSTLFSLADLLCLFLSILLCRFVSIWASPYCFYYYCLVISVVCLQEVTLMLIFGFFNIFIFIFFLLNLIIIVIKNIVQPIGSTRPNLTHAHSFCQLSSKIV